MTDKEKLAKLQKILQALFPEKSGHYFICGEVGEKDENGLPEAILVSPTYGVDWAVIYKKSTPPK